MMLITASFGFSQRKTYYLIYQPQNSRHSKVEGSCQLGIKKGDTPKRRKTLDFYFEHENFRVAVEEEGAIDTCFLQKIDKKDIITIEELKREEYIILDSIANEREKSLGIPFPRTTMYHNLFNIIVLETIDKNRVVCYKAYWDYYVI